MLRRPPLPEKTLGMAPVLYSSLMLNDAKNTKEWISRKSAILRTLTLQIRRETIMRLGKCLPAEESLRRTFLSATVQVEGCVCQKRLTPHTRILVLAHTA